MNCNGNHYNWNTFCIEDSFSQVGSMLNMIGWSPTSVSWNLTLPCCKKLCRSCKDAAGVNASLEKEEAITEKVWLVCNILGGVIGLWYFGRCDWLVILGVIWFTRYARMSLYQGFNSEILRASNSWCFSSNCSFWAHFTLLAACSVCCLLSQ